MLLIHSVLWVGLLKTCPPGRAKLAGRHDTKKQDQNFLQLLLYRCRFYRCYCQYFLLLDLLLLDISDLIMIFPVLKPFQLSKDQNFPPPPPCVEPEDDVCVWEPPGDA